MRWCSLRFFPGARQIVFFAAMCVKSFVAYRYNSSVLQSRSSTADSEHIAITIYKYFFFRDIQQCVVELSWLQQRCQTFIAGRSPASPLSHIGVSYVCAIIHAPIRIFQKLRGVFHRTTVCASTTGSLLGMVKGMPLHLEGLENMYALETLDWSPQTTSHNSGQHARPW